MGKYTPLEEFLKRQSGDSVVLTFGEIEKIIGKQLSPGTRKYFVDWDNTRGSILHDAFLNAGFQTVMVDLENEKVKFQRIFGV